MEDDGPGQQTKHCPNLSVSRLAPVAIHPFFDSGFFAKQVMEDDRQQAKHCPNLSVSPLYQSQSIHLRFGTFLPNKLIFATTATSKTLDTNIMFFSRVRNSSLQPRTRCIRADTLTNDIARSNPTAAPTMTDQKETSFQLEIEPKPQEMIRATARRNGSLQQRRTRYNRVDTFTNDVARSNPTAASTTTDQKEASVQLEIETKPQEMIRAAANRRLHNQQQRAAARLKLHQQQRAAWRRGLRQLQQQQRHITAFDWTRLAYATPTVVCIQSRKTSQSASIIMWFAGGVDFATTRPRKV